MIKNILFLVCLFLVIGSHAQQVVKGQIVDKESKFPLPGVNVKITIADQPDVLFGTATDGNGYFKIADVPVGRHTLQVSFIGYNVQVLTIIVDAGKELITNVELDESTEMLEEFEIVATETHEVKNEMAVVSTRVFSVEETNRYAGSRGDPARMASNFAGVQGADDSRNDIVVRGNSPLGVIYRVEGVDIPNPNHFAIAGSSGGPVSVLNNKLMSNSDFFTGAFPAEYGNSTAGVFDLRLRNGNSAKHEFTAQFGILGAEFMAEGPISKEKMSSYLIMYRYSTFKFFTSLGIDIGTSAIPRYQDLSLKFNFPFKDGGNLSLWGIGGKSGVDIIISQQKDTSEVDLYAENTKDQYFATMMGILGATYSKPINEDLFFKSTLSVAMDRQTSHHDYIIRHIDSIGDFQLDSVYHYMDYFFQNKKVSNATSFNKKFGKKDVLKVGINLDYYFAEYKDSVLKNDSIPKDFRFRWNTKANFGLAQAYVQWKHKFSDDVMFTAGIHSQYFSLSNDFSPVEPRLGLKWKINDKQAMTFGLGRHSQIQPLYSHFYLLPGNDSPHNTHLKMSRSNHVVIGYSRELKKNLMARSEIYYQQLSKIPVEKYASSFSLVNQGSGFSRFFPDSLVNAGTGYNYGAEITIERYYSNSWHMMVTGSAYNSRYTGSDRIERNTDYNGFYALNVLGGKEFELKEKLHLGLGGKFTMAGGKRYGDVDTVASGLQGEVVFKDENYNEYQFRDYMRFDIKISIKKNAAKVTHEFALDLVNIFGVQNILSLSYIPTDRPEISPIRENYQLGFLPIFYYKIDF